MNGVGVEGMYTAHEYSLDRQEVYGLSDRMRP